nr:hypothetical protein [uncultured Pseudodesulfovibrio sp.]
MLTSYQIGEAWKNAVRDAVPVNEFCVERFGKEPRLFMDFDPRDLPGKKDCPYIAFVPHGSPSGGEEEDEREFAVSVFLGTKDGAVEESGREIVYTGRSVIERNFNPLVVAAIEQSGEFVPGRHSWEVAQLDSGFFLLENVFTVNLPNTLGLD